MSQKIAVILIITKMKIITREIMSDFCDSV